MASNKRQKIMASDIKWCIKNASTLFVQNFIEAFDYGDKAAANTRYSAILIDKAFQTNVPNTSQLKQEFKQWKKSQQEQTYWNHRILRLARQTTETNLRVTAVGAVGGMGVEEGQQISENNMIVTSESESSRVARS